MSETQWSTPTETLIAAMEEIGDAASVVIALRHEDGAFTYFVPSQQYPVETLGLLQMSQETVKWEVRKTLDGDAA